MAGRVPQGENCGRLTASSEDKPQVRKLYADLKACGLDPWLDKVDLIPGQNWEIEIPKAIRQAGIFLACLSSRSVGKDGYIQKELRLALSTISERPPGSIYLIPVRLEDCEVPDLQDPDLGLRLRAIHWVDLWEEGGFDKLVRSIEKALEIPDKAPGLLRPAEAAALRLGIAPDQVPPQLAEKPLRDVNEPWCPELVVIPPGKFMMGSTEPERRWAMGQSASREWVDREKPQHQVAIPKAFAVGKHPITGQFAAFIEATAHDMSGGCWIHT